jgi:diguanylate cyclase (GGDEF)-like protein/PAS domain S-box-containing protein
MKTSPTTKEQESNYQKNVAGELVTLLYAQGKAAIIGSFIVASCLVYVLYNIIPTKLLFGWYLAIIIITISRYSLISLFFRITPSTEKSNQWRNYFIIMTTVAGLSWSFVSIYLIPENTLHQIFIVCALAGLSGGAVPYFSGNRIACANFIIPTLLPLALWAFFQGNAVYELLGILISAYLVLLLISCFRTHAVILNAVKLKFENDELVKNLTIAQNNMAIINQELQSEVNERKLAENLLRESEEQYRLVTDALPVLISYVDMKLHYRFTNKAHETWFKKPLSDIIGKPIKDIIGDNAFAIFIEYFEKIRSNKPISYETILQFAEQEERYVSVTLIPHVKNNQIQGVFSLISDMTPRINYLATHDPLTDLPNRSFFNARFSQALKRARGHVTKLAVLFLDLDNFKNINDTLGHNIGDQLLIKVTEQVRNCLRDSDMLARFGGDEFTILLEDINSEQVINIARKISNAFSNAFQLDNHTVFITTSIGISMYPDDGSEMQILLKNADMAIYRAKEHGKNRFEFYTQEMNEKFLKKINIETNLRSAIERNELMIYYQPLIDITTNTIVSVEALLRWKHPVSGLIPPAEFIPIAEETGLIIPISKWVLQTVCDQIACWQKIDENTAKIRIAINLSARQLKERNFAETVVSILNKTGINGKYLTLELTESLIMSNIDRNTKIINSIKKQGINISIDDFGTGYSSLNYLRRFPIDTLKIDRSFITDIIGTTKTSVDAAAIVLAIIAMSHSLKMKVVAEGVETIEQYNFLKKHGCDEIQGFLISKPIPADEITALIQNQSIISDRLKITNKKENESMM